MASKQIPWTEIKAMSFDIFGTLIDWENGIWNALQASDIGPLVPDRKTTMAVLSDEDVKVQAESPKMLQRDVIAEGLRRTAHRFDLVKDGKITQEQLDKTAIEYGRQIGEYKAFPDTVAAVQRLGKRFKLIPLTNVDNQSFQGTLANGLKGVHFDAIYTAEDIGSYKPSRKNFEYLEDHLQKDFGIARDQLCHTAQSLFHDHRPAKAFGLPYKVWVDRQGLIGNVDDYESFDINLRVKTLAELADIVDAAFDKSP